MRTPAHAIILAMLCAGAASAQAPDSAATTRPTRTGADAGTRLPEIMVTARRRAEDAQQVPGSLSVVGGDLLDVSYTVNPQQLSQLVPELSYSSANPRNTAITIRGLGSSVVAVSQSNDGLEPGVGFYVDQVYHARPATAAFDFTDIEQVEVLRGPQGTLFGKNTTAGAISITTRMPTFAWEGQAELSYGRFDFTQAKAAVSGPIVGDTLAIRLSGLVTHRDGVLYNTRLDRHHNEIDNQAVRGQLLWKPTEGVTARLIADWTNFDSSCCTQVFYRVGQSLRPAARQYPALAATFGYAPPSTNPYDRQVDIDAPIGSNTNEGGVSAIVERDFGSATLTSVSAWRFWNWDAANDRDYTGIPIQLIQHIPSRQDQYSQELRLASNGEHALTYVLGLYFFNQEIVGHPISIYGPAAAFYLIGPTTGTTLVPANLLDGYGQDGRTEFNTDSYAAFGELNYRLTDRLTLTGGLRYTYERKDGDYSTSVYGGLATTNTALVNAKLGVLRPQTYAAHDKDGSFSGRANVAWQVADGVLGYASFARGFKSGGINMSGLPLDAANQPALSRAVVDPERNTTWEIGVKSRLLDRRLILNVDAFHTTVKDFQATIVDNGPTQTAALRGYLSNIPKVRVKGIEGDLTALVTRGLSVRASFAYAHGVYADYPQGPCPLELQTAATAFCSLTGRRLSGLPRWSETLGVDYAVPVGLFGGGSVFLHADSNWRSGYNGESALSRYTRIGGYNVTNGSVGYRADRGWEVAVFARNLFDENYIQNVTIQAGNSGLILATPSDPAVYGVTLRFRR